MKSRTRPLRLFGVLMTMLLLLSVIVPGYALQPTLTAQAISTDYPAQLMNLAAKDNSTVLTENGTTDNATLSMKALGSDLAPSWRFDRVGSDANGTFFKLINAQSGRLLTPKSYQVTAGNAVVVYGSESAKSQHWYVVPVKNDRLGNGLYYKIVNYENTSLALTQGGSGMTLANYTGADSQLFLLNSDGLQGFAGYCANDNTGSIKAGDIGGLFGEVVEVSTFADLKKYATSDTPYTIVVTADISVTNLAKDSSDHYYCPDGRIYVHSNKTIIGSYSKHTLYNVQFCTSSKSGTGDNIIIRNFDLQHDYKSNGNDSIVVYFGSGENLWVDHCTFTGHSDYNLLGYETCPDWDKFLACCYDADYCTVSDCSFGLHEYGLILGYPDDTADVKNKYDNYPRMSLISNKFNQTLTRGPGLMRWGYYHSLNNYVNNFSMAYTVHSGCDIYAENCYYENGGNVICDWNSITYAGAYAESGSKFSNCNRTVQGQGTSNNPSYSQPSTWRPSGNYSYTRLTADQAKTYCNTYSACQTSNGNWMYLRYANKGVPSAGYTEVPDGPTAPVAATFTEGAAFRLKNVNSGLYLEVASAKAENGANVQQWGSDGSETHNIWKFVSAGDGYYYIVSCVGDGGTYVLDVAGKKSANGTNIDIYQYNGGTNQQFMITDNGNGTYKLRTRVSGENSAVEIANADTASGANAQQWEINNATCQDWTLETVTDPGCKMDTGVVYTFQNVNSSMVMDIAGGEMADKTNVQQWGSNGYDCQKWTLKAFGSGNYYWIRSLQDDSYALKAEGSTNGSNVDIAAYSSKDSAQLFRFTKNLDGSYSIISHASKDACVVEIVNASKDSGANVQQWESNGNDCQKWNIQTETTTVATTTATTTTTTTTTTSTEPTTASDTEPVQTTTTTTPTPETIPGDIVKDGKLTVADLAAMQKYLLGVQSFTKEQFAAGDFNGDSIVDVFDIALLKRALLNQ